MAEILEEDRRTAAHYIIEEVGQISRETGAYAADNGKVIAGTVLATVGGEFVPLDPAATDGSETATSIAMYPVDTTGGVKRGTVTARLTTVQAEVLVWPEGATDEQKTAALAQLETTTIIAR